MTTIAAAAAARESGLARVANGAGNAWNEEAFSALTEYLRTHLTFFVDDFWNESMLRRPDESRALGPVVLRAARNKLMEQTGEFRPSVASNLGKKAVWRSLLYKEAA